MYRLSILLLATSLIGCASSQVRVDSRGVFAQKPSNVSAYLSITAEGKPLTELKAEDFKIYEDENLVPATHSGQVLLDKELAHAHRTLVLVDYSAATNEDVRGELASALSFFVDRVRKTQAVLVYAFDGREKIRLVADLPKKPEASSPEKRFLQNLQPADTSRNLNGAIIEGIEKLDQAYEKSEGPLRAGTLVVFSGGPDLAGRVGDSAVREALSKTDYTVLTVGVGDSAPLLKDYGRDGFVDGHSLETVSMAFEEAGHLVEDDYGRHYLLSYCSPARAGTRTLRIEVTASEELGTASKTVGTFSAEGFSQGCDAKARPRFEAPTPAEPEQDESQAGDSANADAQ